MNTEIKRHIDGARQVLVGVVPNPTSQIEQITNALIYKFMDDMDQAAIRQGDRPAFFTGDLERYAWTRLMDSRIGNQERMNLYSEALVKFSQAGQLPELFRNIFKSAFLPYRSPETLGLFLKEINFFDYSHPEELGNAYEYLLSIMSSQGDAGQFRTPRHIIDFIVDVVNPTKNDKVLDPACGTGGFLVKAYQHILEQIGKKDTDGNNPKPLTPDERKKLMNNFEGYDIDPTMVRISQVNMYLHQFKNPKIYQYDTLSNEDRWNDKFDVILANPPFMSPRGGIKPHSKFSVQSTRSEVLFVDYIMNHLRPKGRAGIIVPEGIIFQSGASHKQLRKNLVEDGLYCVASLPSGVFAPYSGVKTSILFFDNERATSAKEILFVKIENDGFDLGATKRPITKNDLPQALEILNQWKTGKKSDSKLATYVEKSNIGKTGDYNLSGNRYRVATDYSNAKWPMVEIKTIVNLVKERAKKDEWPYLEIGDVDISSKKYSLKEKKSVLGALIAKKDNIIISKVRPMRGAISIIKENSLVVSGAFSILETDDSKVKSRFLFYLLTNSENFFNHLGSMSKGITYPTCSDIDILNFSVPLPPLEIQEQIVSELDSYQKIIDGAKQIAANWKPKIDIDPKWEVVKLGDVLSFIGSGATPLGGQEVYLSNGILFIRSQNVLWGECDFSDAVFISEKVNHVMQRSQVLKNDVLFNITGASIGRCAIYNENIRANVNQHVTILRCTEKILPRFLLNLILSKAIQDTIWAMQGGASRQALNYYQIRQFDIPLPPLLHSKANRGKN